MYPAYDDESTVPLPVVGPAPARRVRRRRRRGPVVAAAAVVVVLLVGGGLLAWPALFRPAAATSGEVFLESTTGAGRDPFTDTVIVGNPPGTKSQAPPVTGGGAVTAVAGDTPALYGGSRNEKVCDRDKLVAFLGRNPDKAAAWAGVLGIPTADIATYVGTLTPVQLRADTRVTNHGYLDGHATTLQSVLQAGTAVLVDDLGRPRVKCGCGNPLLEPVASPVAPVYTGEAWPGFDPTALSAVSPAAARIASFVLHDLRTGETFTRPRGTAGEADVLTDAPPATPFPVPPATSAVGPGPPAPSCPSGEVRVAGRCVPRPLSCPAGSHPTADGASCVSDAPGVCPQGTHRDGNACVKDAPITCPAGSHPVSDGTSCAKDPPVCRAGTHLEGDTCVPNPPVCQAGTHPDGTTCVKDPPTCTDGTHIEGGVCVKDPVTCKEGYHPVGDRCVKDPVTCKEGYHPVGDTCVKDPVTCKEGYHPVGDTCVKDPVTCKDGYHAEGDRCVKDPVRCDDGYHVVGDACVADPPPPAR